MATKTTKDKKPAKIAKNRAWSYKEEEYLIELWTKYEYLYNTSSKDYKRHDKKAAAVEDMKRSLEEQFEEPFMALYSRQNSTLQFNINVYNLAFMFAIHCSSNSLIHCFFLPLHPYSCFKRKQKQTKNKAKTKGNHVLRPFSRLRHFVNKTCAPAL